MFVIVAYDISDDDLRERLRKTLRRYGDSVQYSVFECVVTEAQLRDMRQAVTTVLEGSDESGVRYYAICEECRRQTQAIGRAKTSLDQRLYVV